MFGFTGTFEGQPVSVQDWGIGEVPLSIYVTELIRDHGVLSSWSGSARAVRWRRSW